MLIRVPISAELAEKMLATGYSIFGSRRIIAGLPPEARLIGVSWIINPRRLLLYFHAANGEGPTVDLDIKVEVDQADQLAHALALENARGVLGSNAIVQQRPDGCWNQLIDTDLDDCANELKYLELRGMLTRRPDEPNLFRYEGDEISDVAAAAALEPTCP